MEFWEKLRRQIGNVVTAKGVKRNGNLYELTGKLKSVDDCNKVEVDYMGFDEIEFYFATFELPIYEIIDQNGNVMYENHDAVDYLQKFRSDDEIVDEKYKLFGDYYLQCMLENAEEYVWTMVKYNDQFRSDFRKTITDPKNNMSYWYPEVANLGFRTPKTEVIKLTSEVTDPLDKYLDSRRQDTESFEEYKSKLIELITETTSFTFDDKLFMKSGVFSNKFNFDNCKVDSLEELPEKFAMIYNVEKNQARGNAPSELVLREFINSSTQRKAIYNGMPLNTEFRVFYDFDNKQVIGIDNYWHEKDMSNGLRDNQDINNYLDEKDFINEEFEELKPVLMEECSKLAESELNGLWSVDFMWNGSEFVLIDMALAECSHAWEKFQHLTPNGIDINQYVIGNNVLPNRVKELINESQIIKKQDPTVME